LNFKAWDNKEATYGTTVSAFVGFKGLWEIMGLYLTSGLEGEDIWSLIPHAFVLAQSTLFRARRPSRLAGLQPVGSDEFRMLSEVIGF
jgi:hypothetical protein